MYLLIFTKKRNPHGILAAGGALLLTHEKKNLSIPIPCTCIPPTPQINSTSSGIRIWNHVGGLRRSFFAAPFLQEQPTCSVDCFRRGASLLIFDGILNVTLPEEIFTTGVTQGNLELFLPPNSLDSHKNRKTIR